MFEKFLKEDNEKDAAFRNINLAEKLKKGGTVE